MTTRKEDKLRPYRVDYFNIDEMQEVDQALVQSVVVRAVTAAEAAGKVITDNEALPIVLIRSYRFYSTLGPRVRKVYKAVEDLFTAKQAIIVMGEVEKYRAQLAASPAPPPPVSGEHVTRMSDSSLYDEVCTKCGATDTSGKLEDPCPANEPVATVREAAAALGIDPKTLAYHVVDTVQNLSGPRSPATVAAVEDLKGFIAHDEHEQLVDKVVVNSTDAEGRHFPQPSNTFDTVEAARMSAPEYGFVPPIEPDQAVGSAGRPSYLNDPMPGASDVSWTPLGTKILLFSGALVLVLFILSRFLHSH